MALFPNFYDMEQNYRSLVLGLKKTVPRPAKPLKKQPTRKGMFISLNTGLESLIEAVEKRLEPGSIMKGTGVIKIVRAEEGYHCLLANGTSVKADSIVIATDHFHAQQMLSDYSFMDVFKNMPSNSIANVVMGFPKSAIKQDIEGTGFVVSRNSDHRITACTWTHKKWPTSTPEGKVLLRCFIGKPDDQGVIDLTDEEIIKIVLNDLNKTMNITAEPEFHIITRWKKAMPQYTIGHLERMKNVKESLAKELPGVFLAGASFEGVGIPGCIDQGETAKEKVLHFL
jgi:oxygen-dependent protoporphyrinogen oxidase